MAKIVCAECGAVIAEDNARIYLVGTNRYQTNNNAMFYELGPDVYLCSDCFENGYFQCDDCGGIFSQEEEHYEDGVGRSVCEDCDDNYATCEYCGERYEVGDMHTTIDDGDVCDYCYNRHYYTCEGCERAISEDDAIHTEDGYSYCQSCYEETYTTCDECGEELFREDAYWTSRGPLCERCISDLDYRQCSECGEYVPPEDAYECPDGSVLCIGCGERRRRASGMSAEEWSAEMERQHAERLRNERERLRSIEPPTTILSYHNNTQRCFLAQDGEDTKMFFGIELESETKGRCDRDDAASRVLRLLNHNTDGEIRNHWTAMRDGSLNNGFELISQPMTARYFDEEVAPVLENVLKEMVDMGLRSHDTATCGLHFHVSRNAIDEDTMVNMKIAADKFKDTLVTISRRKPESLERWAQVMPIVCEFYTFDKSKWDIACTQQKARLSNGGRYVAVNFTNCATIELRIFQGTLKYSSFIGCLHFFRFLIDWCARHTFTEILEEVSERQFIADMAAYSPELKAYVIDRKLMEAEADDNDELAA